MTYKSWNVSQRIIHELDRKTHKYLIEPISGTQHIMFALQKRFINFIKKINASKKTALRMLYETVKLDCQSTTGRNLRMLILLYDLDSIDDLLFDVLKGK